VGDRTSGAWRAWIAAALLLGGCGSNLPTEPSVAETGAAPTRGGPNDPLGTNAGNCAAASFGDLHDSTVALARAFLEALERDDASRLRALAVGEDEFRCLVWPHLPASRPETGFPFEFVWGDLNQKSLNALQWTRYNWGGRRLLLQRVLIEGGAREYGPLVVHRDVRLRVTDEQGQTGNLSLFGSILESGGRYKLYSFVTD
jgi:hypothetical protein